MATIATTGRRRHYQIVDFGETSLRQALELIFTEEQQPTFVMHTEGGIFASSRVEVLEEPRMDGCEIQPLSAGDYCRTVASEAIHFFQGLPWATRSRMCNCEPLNPYDNPQPSGWRLDMLGREDGIILVQIKPAWWS